ncbi:hypothetical protein A3H18_00025 [Candidatus Daviesbacteria bacterium RIFCSPLOWO2_12_FULL_38_10]|nr:MAG: hypothetical protein A3E67_01115 [Candidatus Daviesbacteria bacterium RIFCSPHIGHO2_12_FULL_38_25]OGE73213.1 MAG: hypothetical protein A3H18_00025 [Candidatus Daviesbacteria bacterium RIFCSPLOWO2_12_FULL_38_10]
MESLGTTVAQIMGNFFSSIGRYLPQFIAGLILLLVGLSVAALFKEAVIRFLAFLKVDEWLGSVSSWFNKLRSEKVVKGKVWIGLLSELVRWTVVILFLVPAAEAWGLTRVTDLLNQFLFYVPNVFVAVVIGFIGLVVARLVSEVVKNASQGLGGTSSNLLATTARYALFFFTALVVLNQLGVAADLVRILFTGIVAMIAVAGGIAFGLGGQESAKKLLSDLQKKIEK